MLLDLPSQWGGGGACRMSTDFLLMDHSIWQNTRGLSVLCNRILKPYPRGEHSRCFTHKTW